MNNKKFLYIIVVLSIFCGIIFKGCDDVFNEIKHVSDNKPICSLNTDDVTMFDYNQEQYRILDEQVSEDNIGELVAHINKLVTIDKNGKIVNQRNIGIGATKNLSKMKENYPDAAAILPFQNIYKAKKSDSFLIVDVDGSYRKAVLSKSITDKKKVFNIKDKIKGGDENGEFTVSKNDATQLCCSGKVYQVTNSTIVEDKLGQYLDCIAESVTFDANKKKPLTKKELSAIDWQGNKQAKEARKTWLYSDVYEIQGRSTDDVVAVRINDEKFYIAKKK